MTGRVAVITGGSQGIGAGLVAEYRRRGWAVVANALMIKPSGLATDPVFGWGTSTGGIRWLT
jgi:NAD(P)-dependent dehydrogenase (short-subunit alcohol dehydrogenase family)